MRTATPRSLLDGTRKRAWASMWDSALATMKLWPTFSSMGMSL